MPNSDAMPGPDTRSGGSPWSALWRRARRWAFPLLGLVVLGLLLSHAHNVDWGGAWEALGRYSPGLLLATLALCTASHALYGCYDLLGRLHTRHRIARWRTWAIAVTSYAFNLNLGSLVGGVAFRFRLYSRLGLRPGAITRIMSISMLANWMGYVLLAGLVFSLHPPMLPPDWPVTAGHLRLAGVMLLAAAAGYLAICSFTRRRHYELRGHTIELPSPRLAVLQLLMGAGNWLTMSGILYILLQHRIEFSAVASVLLLAAVAGVITHIPGGLGVLEAVFVALLSHLMPQAELLAALVAYRVIYYLAPLGVATAAYLAMEARSRQLRQQRR